MWATVRPSWGRGRNAEWLGRYLYSSRRRSCTVFFSFSGGDGGEDHLDDRKAPRGILLGGLVEDTGGSNAGNGEVHFARPNHTPRSKRSSPTPHTSAGAPTVKSGKGHISKSGSGPGVLATAFVTGGVVRLAPSSSSSVIEGLKMEYPHHHGAADGGQTSSADSGQTSTIVVHSSHDGVCATPIIMHPQHVEVIKHVPSLQHNSPTEGTLAGQHMSPKDQDLQGASVLQVINVFFDILGSCARFWRVFI